MRVITFYSFKGGVGRSNLLLNVAYQLAAKHSARVVIADADLHAPGLTCLPDLQDPEGHLASQGLLDVLVELAAAAEKKDPDAEVTDPSGLVHPTHIGRRIHRGIQGNGDIWFLPAGAFMPGAKDAYQDKLQAMRSQLPRLVSKDGPALLEWLVARIRARFDSDPPVPDYLLLDARTGLTELGELLMSNLPQHHIVLVFGLNDQNLEGMDHVLRWLVKDLGPANVASRVVLVASPVPSGEEELKKQRKSRALQVVDEVIRRASEEVGVVPAMPPFFMVPYHPLVALTESPISEHYPDSEIARVFASVTEVLRIRPLAVERVQQEVSLAVREQAPQQAPEEPLKVAKVTKTSEHPMARRLAWNVVRPDATPAALWAQPPARAEDVLTSLANTISLADEVRREAVDSLPAQSAIQIDRLISVLREGDERLRQLSDDHWPALARMRGTGWAEWALLSAKLLRVQAAEAARRFVHAWPFGFQGVVAANAVVGAAHVLTREQGPPSQEARELLVRVAEQNAGDSAALAVTGAAWIRLLGDVEAGNDCFDKAVRLASDIEDVEWQWGTAQAGRAALVRDKDAAAALRLFEAAEAHYRRAVEIKPGKHEAEYNWGNALASRAELVREKDAAAAHSLFEVAEAHYRRAVEIKPDKHEAEYNWGVALAGRAALAREKDAAAALTLFEAAEAHYRRAVEIKPDNHEAENNWGTVLADRARLVGGKDAAAALTLFEAAEAHYRRAVEIKPDKHEAEFNWGNALAGRARLVSGKDATAALTLFEAAEARYRRAVEIKPDKHEAEFNWGAALADRAKLLRDKDAAAALTLFEAAEARYRRAVEIKPVDQMALDGWTSTLLWKNHIYKALGRGDEGKAAVEQALSMARRTVESLGRNTYDLACALAQADQADAALAVLEDLRNRRELEELSWLREDPDMEPLRGHPRFEALLASSVDETQGDVSEKLPSAGVHES